MPDDEWKGAMGLVDTPLAGKRLTWRLLLKQEANARLSRYVDVKGRKELRKAIEDACPLMETETSAYRRRTWMQECLKLLDLHRHPPPAAFHLSNDFHNEPVVSTTTLTRKRHRRLHNVNSHCHVHMQVGIPRQ